MNINPTTIDATEAKPHGDSDTVEAEIKHAQEADKRAGLL